LHIMKNSRRQEAEFPEGRPKAREFNKPSRGKIFALSAVAGILFLVKISHIGGGSGNPSVPPCRKTDRQRRSLETEGF